MALYQIIPALSKKESASPAPYASTLQNARDQILKMGLFITGLEAVSTAARPAWYSRIFTRGISLKDKIFFTKQLAGLLRAGVPLLQSLELLVEQTDGALKNIVIALKDGIKEGRSLADGLARYPQAFDSIYVQLVRAGEATGKLEMILERLVDFLERQDELKKKVSGALRYPIFSADYYCACYSGSFDVCDSSDSDRFPRTKYSFTASYAYASWRIKFCVASLPSSLWYTSRTSGSIFLMEIYCSRGLYDR